MFKLLSEEARGRPTCSVQATWRPRAPCWWLVVSTVKPVDYVKEEDFAEKQEERSVKVW